MNTRIDKRIVKFRVRKPEDAELEALAAAKVAADADMSTSRDGRRAKVVRLTEPMPVLIPSRTGLNKASTC